MKVLDLLDLPRIFNFFLSWKFARVSFHRCDESCGSCSEPHEVFVYILIWHNFTETLCVVCQPTITEKSWCALECYRRATEKEDAILQLIGRSVFVELINRRRPLPFRPTILQDERSDIRDPILRYLLVPNRTIGSC